MTEQQMTEAQVAELYVATFGRAPDAAGLEYWTNEVTSGKLTLDGVAQSFFDQDETQTMYGNTSNEDFIISVYQNTLGRDVDGSDEGVQYWVNELDSGAYSKDVAIKTIIDGAKAETGSPEDAQLLQNRVNTGLLYSQDIGTEDSPLAKEIISSVTADPATVEDAMGSITYYKDWVTKYEEALGSDSDITTEELYQHINDNEYWANLEETHTLNFDEAPSVKFWEEDDALWTAPDATETNDIQAKFGFLENEDAWADANQYQSFHDGEFANMNIDKIFELDTKTEVELPYTSDDVTTVDTDAVNVELSGVTTQDTTADSTTSM